MCNDTSPLLHIECSYSTLKILCKFCLLFIMMILQFISATMQYCFGAGAFKACFVIRNHYVIIVLRCYNNNIENLCLLNWFLLQYLYYDKCVHKFWLLIKILATPMYEWWGWSRRCETEPDHHQTLKAEEVYLFISKPWNHTKVKEAFKPIKICETVSSWKKLLV